MAPSRARLNICWSKQSKTPARVAAKKTSHCSRVSERHQDSPAGAPPAAPAGPDADMLSLRIALPWIIGGRPVMGRIKMVWDRALIEQHASEVSVGRTLKLSRPLP